MRATHLVLPLLAAFSLSALADDLKIIEGQVFIRTKSAETIKLSLVTVSLFDEASIKDHLSKKRNEAQPVADYLRTLVDAAQKSYQSTKKQVCGDFRASFESKMAQLEKVENVWNKRRAELDYTNSGLYYFSELPKAVQTTKTDADAKFTFKIPSGSYILVAATSRLAGNSTEYYYWMIRIRADSDQRVFLANDNLSSSGSSDSLIQTPEDEKYVVPVMAGRSLQSLLPQKKP